MNRISLLFLALLLATLCASEAAAQVTMNVLVRRPTPTSLTEWRRDPTIVRLTLANASRDRHENTLVSIVIRDLNSDAIVARTRDDSPAMPRFTLLPGHTLALSGPDIIRQEALEVDQSLRSTAITTDALPEGSYEFCVRLLASDGVTELAVMSPVCAPFDVIIPDPPMLIAPWQEQVLPLASNPVFQWTPVAPLPTSMRIMYRLRVVPIFTGQTPRQAIESNTEHVVDKRIASTSMPYTPADKPFSAYPSAVAWAWQVQALDVSSNTMGVPAARNEGKSEIGVFSFGSSKAQQQQPGNIVQHQQQQNASPDGCNAACITPPPSVMTLFPGSLAIGDSVTVGLFTMELTELSNPSPSALSGKGLVQVPYLKARLIVEFTGIRVNSLRQVLDPGIQAVVQSPISIPQANNMAQRVGMNPQTMQDIQTWLGQSGRLVSAFTGLTPVNLPVGIDNTIPGTGQQLVVSLIGAVFNPDGAQFNAVCQLPLPFFGPNGRLGFGVNGVCMHPGGIGAGNTPVHMYLIDDFGYNPMNGSWSVQLLREQNGQGSYAEIDCTGFKKLHVHGEVGFARTALLPVPDNGQTVKLNLITDIQKDNVMNWLVQLSTSGTFAPTALPDFTINVPSMWMDFSDTQNPPQMAFPDDYTGPNKDSLSWHGFFMPTATVTLPQQFKTGQNPVTVSINNMLVDNTGFTAGLQADDIIAYPDMNVSSWGASLDHIDVQITNSSFKHGSLNGTLQIPISTQPLAYSMVLAQTDSGMSYLCNVIPGADIDVPMWALTLTIEPTSIFQLTANSTGFEAFIELNGMLGFQKTVGTIPLINLTGLKFSKLKLTTNEPYFELGQMALASPQHGVGGFPVSLTGVKPVVEDLISNKPKFGLQFGMALNLMGSGSDASGISGETHFTVLGSYDKITRTPGFEDAYIDDITLSAQLGAAVKIDGTIIFYRNNAEYGNGFFGTVQAQFLEMVEINATAMFGSKQTNQNNSFRYWMADAKAIIPGGIPLGGVMVIRGMGIGAWYNMSAQMPAQKLTISEGHESNSASAQIGVTNSGIKYTPSSQGEWGLKATVVIAAPSDQLFNADVELGASFLNGGLASIFLNGQGYMLTSLYDRSDPSVYGSVGFFYDNVHKEFTGNLDIAFNVYDVITGGGNVVLFASPEEWYLWMGRPTQRINLELLGVFSANSYFEVGTTIDKIAEIPSQIMSHLSPNLKSKFSNSNRQSAVDMAANFGGAAFGVWSGFPKKKFTFGPFYASLAAGFGFDASVMNYGDLKCSNTDQVVGLDGWYCQAQAYAYISGAVGISVDLAIISGDFEILGVDAGAALKAQLPNPTWLGGVIYGSYSILGGLISGSVSFEFEVGEQCKLPQSNPLDNIKLVSDFRPDGKEIADVYTIPQASFTFPVHKEFELPVTTPSGDPSTRVFKINIDEYRIERKDTKEKVDGIWAIQEGGVSAVLVPKAQLRSNTYFKTRITASAWEKKNGQFVKSLYSQNAKNGTPGTHIVERDSVIFRTGLAPNHLPSEQVQYSWPLDRQRFFLQDQILPKMGFIITRIHPDGLFTYSRPGFSSTYLAKFQPLNNKDSMSVKETPVSYVNGEIRFPIPQLDNNTTYKLMIVRRDEKLTSNTTSNLVSGTSGLDKLKTTVQSTIIADSRSDQAKGGTTLSEKQGTVQVTEVGTSSFNAQERSWSDQSYGIGQQLASSTVAINQSRLLANLVSGGDKKLYEINFRTSTYNTMPQKINAATVKPSTSETNGNSVLARANFTLQEALEDYEVIGHMYKGQVLKNGLYYEQDINAGPLLVVKSDEQTKPWHTGFALPKIYQPQQQVINVMKTTKSSYFKAAFRYWNSSYYRYWRDNTQTLVHIDRKKSRILDGLSDNEINPPAPKAPSYSGKDGKGYLPGGYTVPQQNLPVGQYSNLVLSSMAVNYTHGVAAALDYQSFQNRLAKFFTAKVYTNNQNPDENGDIEYSKGGPKIEKTTVYEVGDPKRDYSGAVYTMLESLWKTPFKKLQKGTYPLRFSFKLGPNVQTVKNTSFTW